MSDLTVEKISLALISGLPAIIAAISSVKNGLEQRRVRQELAEVNGKISESGVDGKRFKKKAAFTPDDPQQASNPDWYKAPDFT